MPPPKTSAHYLGLESCFSWLIWRIHPRICCVLGFQHSVYVLFPCSSEWRAGKLMKLVIREKTVLRWEEGKNQNLKHYILTLVGHVAGLACLRFLVKCETLSFPHHNVVRSLNERSDLILPMNLIDILKHPTYKCPLYMDGRFIHYELTMSSTVTEVLEKSTASLEVLQ